MSKIQRWKNIKLKYLADMRSGESITSEAIEPAGLYPVYGGGALRGYTSEYTHKGKHVLIGRQGANCGNVKTVEGKFWASEHAVVVTPNSTIDVEWLGYLLESMNLNQYSMSAAQPGLAVSMIKNLEVLVPPRDIQEKITKYINSKVSSIEDLIKQKEKLVQLIQEKRQLIITEAITKGLNPNVKMKDSGIEWIGEIPEHWNTVSVRNLLRNNVIECQDGNHGELHPISDEYVEDGIPFVMANNVRDNELNLNHCKYISQERAEKLRIGFSISGDVLLTHKGTVGEVSMVPNDLPFPFIMLTPQVTYYRVKKYNVITNGFLEAFFQSYPFKNQLKIISSMQSTRQYVGLVAQRKLITVLPPIEEQIEIIKMIDEAQKPIKEAINNIRLQVKELKHYRQSLVYEAVTGKIDVNVK